MVSVIENVCALREKSGPVLTRKLLCWEELVS